MRRILFVDDEERVLDGLRNLLRRKRREWDMTFALGGEKAIAEMEAHPFDVVVTDMRMPGMDGAALLRHVQEAHPGVVRIVLSGHTEMQAALRAIPVAHQFLTKPCEPEVLQNTIERACSLQSILGDDRVRSAVGRVERLPSMPHLCLQLEAALASESCGPQEIARLVEQDLGMTAKILQLVNSAFFRLARQISTVQEAVVYLGVNTLKNLVLSVHLFESAAEDANNAVRHMQIHAFCTATVAAHLVKDTREAGDVFTAALLHDVGRLVLAREFPEDLATERELVQSGVSGLEAERRAFGVSHTEVGGYLVGSWGLPYPIVEAATHHHTPMLCAPTRLDLLSQVHIADVLTRRAGFGAAPALEVGEDLDSTLIERLHLTDRLDAWQRMADERCAAVVETM